MVSFLKVSLTLCNFIWVQQQMAQLTTDHHKHWMGVHGGHWMGVHRGGIGWVYMRALDGCTWGALDGCT